MIYSTLLSHTHNVQAAEEITQDVFVKIFRSADTFQGDSKVSTWAYRIAIRTMIDYQRKSKRDSLVFPEVMETNSSTIEENHPQHLLEMEEKKTAILSAIDELPDSQKTAFILAYIDGIPQQEIAIIMETSVKAVESLLQRGKSKLRKKLK